MSLFTRMANAFRGDRLSRDLHEEMQSHIDEAVRHGRDPEEARRAFGSPLRLGEASRDLKVVAWLDALRADAVFGWRRIAKHKVTSLAAILSLGLAMGACVSAFRLTDALLFRPLPIPHPDRLYSVAFENPSAPGPASVWDSCSYPMFRRMREDLRGQAELVAVSYSDRMDLTYGGDQDMEKAYQQFISGWTFSLFGLNPALGRLFTAEDDSTPGAHPYAVISYDYWTRRFGQDPRVVGRTFRARDTIFEIIGVAPQAFTGTETGVMTDVFMPMAMKTRATLDSPNNFWLRTLVLLSSGVAPNAVHAKLAVTFHALQEEQAKAAVIPKHLEDYFRDRLLLEAAPAGRSNMQRDYRRALAALAVLVALVLLIACANVANLMTAQIAARSREMALRVSIGAGRRRLVQLVIVESVLLALLSAAVGGAFAFWAAPFVAGRINPPNDPARLVLTADVRVIAFGIALTLAVALLFGLAPALSASGMQPVNALKGGSNPHARKRTMHSLIALQVAFAFVVLFVAGLFMATFDHLTHQSNGYSAARIVNLETVTRQPTPTAAWDQTADHLLSLPGIEKVALISWPVMSGESRVSYVVVNGEHSDALADFFSVSPGWLDAMNVPLVNGRDFLPNDAAPRVAVANEAFAKQYFGGEDPTGKWFEDDKRTARTQIIGYVRDVRLRDDLRRQIRPTAFVPIHASDATGALQPLRRGTFVVRTSSDNPLALAASLRQEVPRAAGAALRVTNIRTQEEIVRSTTLRERLLAMLALFFGGVALLLAGIGLYGVLDYSVLQRRREIGIRMAIGARPAGIARLVTARIAMAACAGAVAGLVLGIASARYIQTLLFGVKPADPLMLAGPAAAVFVAACVAALPAVLHAVRIDPIEMLRSEQ